MTLKMTLVSQEWLMVGDTKVVNISTEIAKFKIDGAAPILRQAHTMSELDTDTAAKRVYLALQMLYLGQAEATEPYFSAVDVLLEQCPSAIAVVQNANRQIAGGSYYGALREYRKLIQEQLLSSCA